MSESRNPADHADHDPARCDFARINLIQQFVAGNHVEPVSKLSDEQIFVIGITCSMEAGSDMADAVYAPFGLNASQVFDFSEYLRKVLIEKHDIGLPQGNPFLN